MVKRVHTLDQLLEVLDQVVVGSRRGDRSEEEAAGYWTELLTTPGHPLATRLPDEPLVDWFGRGLLGDLNGARVLDIGCGGGRNSRWFAEQGAAVEGVDLAAPLLDQVRPAMPASVNLTALNVLRDPLPPGPYDLVYDSGCFHHLAPHRRLTYLERVLPAVRPGGRYAIVTFAAELMETPSDAQIIQSGDTAGGMAFSFDDLREIFTALQPVELRAVRTDRQDTFGRDFLNAGLFVVPQRASADNCFASGVERALAGHMASRLYAVCFDARDPRRLQEFWGELLRWEPAGDGLVSDGVAYRLRFLPSGLEKWGPNQMHFDLTSASDEGQQETVERALRLGARHHDVGQKPEEGHVVLADPEGNEFCVVEAGNKFLAGTGVIGALSSDGTQEVGYFWSKALDWPLVWDQDQETAIQSPAGGTKIAWGGPPVEPKLGKNRLHLDLVPDTDQAAEVARLLSLGATHADIGQGDTTWTVLADPDGNEFCLLAS